MELQHGTRGDVRPTMLPRGPEPPGTYAGGYSLLVDRAALPYGRPGSLRYKVLDPEGRTVRNFDMRHGGRMHLFVVRRRDLAHYVHLHPSMSLDGTWWAPLEFPEAGVYRAIANFSVGGVEVTLGTDVPAPGSAEATPVPDPSTTESVDGYEVAIGTDPLLASSPGRVRFRILRGGREVAGLQEHFGSRAHLLGLRAGDLLLLRGRPLPPRAANGATLGFEVAFPGEGRYRLFLRFAHGGAIRTAAFTVEVRS